MQDPIKSNHETCQPPADNEGRRIFGDCLRWTDMSGRDLNAIPGHSPFILSNNSVGHILKITSLDLNIIMDKPDGIKFDLSMLQGMPQTPCYQMVSVSANLEQPLEHWPYFCLRQSLAEGEPPGFPDFTPLKPWEDERIGWVRIYQNGSQLSEKDRPVAGPIIFECCCVGMIDDPSQGGLRGRYVFEFAAFTDASDKSKRLTEFEGVFWIKSRGDKWVPEYSA